MRRSHDLNPEPPCLPLPQARWVDDSSLLILPHMDEAVVSALEAAGITCLPQLMDAVVEGEGQGQGKGRQVQRVPELLSRQMGAEEAQEVIQVRVCIRGSGGGGVCTVLCVRGAGGMGGGRV